MKYSVEVSVNNGFMGYFNDHYLGQFKREIKGYDLDNDDTREDISKRVTDTVRSFPGQKVTFAFEPYEAPKEIIKEEDDDDLE